MICANIGCLKEMLFLLGLIAAQIRALIGCVAVILNLMVCKIVGFEVKNDLSGYICDITLLYKLDAILFFILTQSNNQTTALIIIEMSLLFLLFIIKEIQRSNTLNLIVLKDIFPPHPLYNLMIERFIWLRE